MMEASEVKEYRTGKYQMIIEYKTTSKFEKLEIRSSMIYFQGTDLD